MVCCLFTFYIIVTQIFFFSFSENLLVRKWCFRALEQLSCQFSMDSQREMDNASILLINTVFLSGSFANISLFSSYISDIWDDQKCFADKVIKISVYCLRINRGVTVGLQPWSENVPLVLRPGMRYGWMFILKNRIWLKDPSTGRKQEIFHSSFSAI